MKIEILGTGCAKCHTLEENARAAADELELDYELEKVSTIDEITARGVMMTPAMLVDGEIQLQGRVPSLEQVRSILSALIPQ